MRLIISPGNWAPLFQYLAVAPDSAQSESKLSAVTSCYTILVAPQTRRQPRRPAPVPRAPGCCASALDAPRSPRLRITSTTTSTNQKQALPSEVGTAAHRVGAVPPPGAAPAAAALPPGAAPAAATPPAAAASSPPGCAPDATIASRAARRRATPFRSTSVRSSGWAPCRCTKDCANASTSAPKVASIVPISSPKELATRRLTTEGGSGTPNI